MINIEDFVRKRLAVYRAYDIRDRRPGRGKEGKLTCGPDLLFSREKGAGGSAVARRTGERLGWQVFDSELVDAIAEKANIRRELIESLDARDQTTILKTVAQLLRPQSIDKAGYRAHLREIILALGHQGEVVIVGRGAHFILPNRFGLRVRMVAPVEVRAQRIAGSEKLSLKAARSEIERSDQERGRLAHREFRRTVSDPLNYDVTINTAELTVEKAAEIVLNALHQKLAVEPKRSTFI